MKLVFVGAGAVGCMYGGMLLLSGHHVTFVGRPPHTDAVREHGLHVSGVMGDHVLHPQITDDASTISRADFVFITTKAYDTLEAAREIRHLVDSGSYVVILQNGIGTERAVASELHTTRVIRATTCAGARKTSHNEVVITGFGVTEIGTHYPEHQDATQTVASLIEKAGFPVRASANLDGLVWTKTIVNCGINPVGALTGMTNGEIHDCLSLRPVVIGLVDEATRVARAMGIHLTTDDPVRYTLGTAKATASNINSMLQDLRAGKRTEIDHMTGAVVRLGRELGVPVPLSEAVYALVTALESKVRSRQQRLSREETLTPERLIQELTSS
ncbi:MAG: 2-dehydropantoate 2-reductase [Candidatus Thorarchaeota archaeon]|nr:2-dehydropantoate 2-reductase [Candidatus Thorarchaeota archaeon]